MQTDDILEIIRSLVVVADAIPDPVGSIIGAALELAEEAVTMGSADPAARIDELRAMLKAGVTWDLQKELDKKP